MSDSDSEEEYVRHHKPDMDKIRKKMAHLPTLEKLLAETDPNKYTQEQLELSKKMVLKIISFSPRNDQEIQAALKHAMKEYKSDGKKSFLLAGYKELLRDKVLTPFEALERYLITKAPRSQSGVLVVTVFTSAYPNGQRFSCKWNCYYCPNEPGQPRSYLLNEPGVRRANRLEFDPVKQFEDRVQALLAIGHPADKVELLVLGGTWESYPEDYRLSFMRDLFYAANTLFDPQPKRPRLDLFDEQLQNETAQCKIIGVTLETRPDTVNPQMLVKLRQYGCTRVQLGVQHTDDTILTLVNRQATREDTVRAIRMLKNACFKVDIHLMPDLPGATPEADKKMFLDVLQSPDLQADQWKIYPCQTTPFTVIKQWYEQGKYQPYSFDSLVDVILFAKRRIHPWIRINRVVRDIPIEYVLAGVEVANLRQLLDARMEKEGQKCQCIRCREIKGDKDVLEKLQTARLFERRFESSGCTEVFLSFETPDKQTIFAFLRLRLPVTPFQSASCNTNDDRHRLASTLAEECPFVELQNTAMIRELHVYGNLVPTNSQSFVGGEKKAQHLGLGTRLLDRAEFIAGSEGYRHISVISGVGVRNYYRRRGYKMVEEHRGAFLIKVVPPVKDVQSIIRDYAGEIVVGPSSAQYATKLLLLCLLVMALSFVYSYK